MGKHRKGTGQGALRGLLVLIVLLTVLLALGCGILFTRYTWVAGDFRPKGQEALNLHGQQLTLADYRELTEAFPGREILWDVPLQGSTVPWDAASVTVSTMTAEDWQALEYLPNLTQLRAAGCRDYEALADFQNRHPRCQVQYTLTLGDSEVANDAKSITVANGDGAQLERLLPYMTQLTQVELTGRIPEEETMDGLIEAFPQVFFRYPIRLGSTTVDSAAEELNLQGMALTQEQITRLLERMPRLTRVNLLGCTLTDEQVASLAAAYPGCQFLWEVHLGGRTYRTDEKEIDLSDWKLEGPEEIEALLPCFYGLERVIMCRCGLDDETMDALNRRYEDIRFVWSVKIKHVEIRTDATWFYPFKYERNMTVNEEDLYPLRYCVDMEAIDIGHMGEVKTCEWAAFMPNLKYLIIVETAITDISPLANLKNLVFLEIFTTKITDYTPLLGCTALEDLNLGLTYGSPKPIMQMTWLKNLWWSGIEGSYGLPCSNAPELLRKALPNTTMKFNLETPNVNNGWRQLDNYKAMRALMDVFCLT